MSIIPLEVSDAIVEIADTYVEADKEESFSSWNSLLNSVNNGCVCPEVSDSAGKRRDQEASEANRIVENKISGVRTKESQENNTMKSNVQDHHKYKCDDPRFDGLGFQELERNEEREKANELGGNNPDEEDECKENERGMHDKDFDLAHYGRKKNDSVFSQEHLESQQLQYNEEHGRQRKRESKKFPPPIPFFARTCHMPCHAPWVHLRSFKTGGRLVIQEVKVPHHEFFKAKRCNGRLTLQLIRHDDHMSCQCVDHLDDNKADFEVTIPNEKVHEAGNEETEKNLEMQAPSNSHDTRSQDRNKDDQVPSLQNRVSVPSKLEKAPTQSTLQYTNFSSSSLQQQHGASSPSSTGCCSPTRKPLFGMPIPTMRAVLS